MQKGAKLTLKKSPVVEAEETLVKIQVGLGVAGFFFGVLWFDVSQTPEKNKMALHMLSKNFLRDDAFVEAWLERGGLKAKKPRCSRFASVELIPKKTQALVDAMLCTTGSTQGE